MINEVIINSERLALIVRANFYPERSQFLTKDDDILQLGYIVYGAGKFIVPHIHKNVKRNIVGTPEVLIVKRGKMKTTFYDDKRKAIGEETLSTGDIIILFKGGHGFEMIEDTILVEVKQGPYLGELDKEKF